ncbi:hypothetical protein PV08_01380 [Exophiala spinifera]|uniref:Uncharacterized protein n=1 Tax=Exophiala spinifera TaxID=91928 RepID=A0A0D2A7N6_9EURO|nr:uncharacterized protein PV08_01380 [Exophiala spinifera]KIW20802.1 hypothetical protein PV08_01380 [Exophiala spinifera]
MAVTAIIFSLYHAAQTCVGVYTGLFSAIAIYNLKQREEQAERAAQYSTTAANQLHKTRTTQTSAAIATISSVVTSVILAIGTGGRKLPLFLSTAHAVGIALVYQNMAEFWKHKAKVPFFHNYNEGINASNKMLGAFQILSTTWFFAIVLYLWPGFAF